MKKFLQLLRLEYAFLWAVPYFLGLIYMKSVYAVEKLDPYFLIAAMFLTASVNVHNDLCEDKLRGYGRRFLKAVIVVSLIAGLVIFPNIFIIFALLITYLYNWKLKKVEYVDLLLPVAPPLAVMAVLGLYEPFLLLAVSLMAVVSQSGQQLIDRDVRKKAYFYIYIVSYVSFLFTLSAAMFMANVAVGWLIFIVAAASLAGISKAEYRNDLLRRLTRATRHQRRVIIANAWLGLVFLAGWYFLITLL